MAVKINVIFSVTTEASNRTQSSPHSGSWSEGLWIPNFSPLSIPDQNSLCIRRAALLPSQVTITGIRQGIYTLAGNKINPSGTSARKVQYPGTSGLNLNLPQDSLELSGTSNSSTNSNRFRLGALPDECTNRGEYAPTPTYQYAVDAYRNYLSAGGQAYFFIGRVLSNPTAIVESVAVAGGGVATVKLAGPLTLTVGGDYLRFNRVYGSDGESISGSWRVTAFAAPATYTIEGYPGNVVLMPSGTARVDQVSLFQYGGVEVGRAVVRKIGRPTSSYRGRRSKRRKA